MPASEAHTHTPHADSLPPLFACAGHALAFQSPPMNAPRPEKREGSHTGMRRSVRPTGAHPALDPALAAVSQRTAQYAKDVCDLFPARFRQLLRELGLSCYRLHELTGVSKEMLRKIALGDRFPSVSVLARIANGIDLTFLQLVQRLFG